LLLCTGCHTPTREARRMVKRAEQLASTQPDSAVRLIDSVLRMEAYLNERERMEMALLQGEIIFHNIKLDDDNLLDSVTISPELERAASFFAKNKQYAKAAHAALFSGYIQMHYGENVTAMRSLKEAEQYSASVPDSLTTARAQYWMAKLLYFDGMGQEALAMLKAANQNIGSRINDKALILNAMASNLLLTNQYDSAEICIRQSLDYADKTGSETTLRKASNNYAVLCRLRGNNEDAITYLRQVINNSNPDETDLIIYYLNLAKTYVATKEMDSASAYFKRIEILLPNSETKEETKVSAYGALSQFAEQQGDAISALQYREARESLLYKILVQRQEQTIYRIQQQYNYESLQNTMGQKNIQKHRIITFLAIIVALVVIALAISQIRLARIRKKEDEANANLFHFMQQNKELIQNNLAQERQVSDTTQQLSELLSAWLRAMQKLDYCLKTPKDKIALKDLEKEVFGDGDHWEAVKEVLVAMYPGLWETLKLKFPEMDEMELRVCMLSRLKLSRLGEATLLGISTSVLDKLRTKVRKRMEQDNLQ